MVVSKDSRPTSGLHATAVAAAPARVAHRPPVPHLVGSDHGDVTIGVEGDDLGGNGEARGSAQAHLIGSGDRVGRRDDQHLVAVDNGDTGAEGGLEAAALGGDTTTTVDGRQWVIDATGDGGEDDGRHECDAGTHTDNRTPPAAALSTAASHSCWTGGPRRSRDRRGVGSGRHRRSHRSSRLIRGRVSRYVSCTVSWRAPFQMSSGIGSSAAGRTRRPSRRAPTARCPNRRRHGACRHCHGRRTRAPDRTVSARGNRTRLNGGVGTGGELEGDQRRVLTALVGTTVGSVGALDERP